MDPFNPFKLAAFWTGMALGIPMLATELAAEVWETKPKPAPVPVEKPVAQQDLTLTNGSIVTADEVDTRPWRVTDPIVLEPGRIEELPPGFALCRDLPVYLASDDLPPPASSIEVETPLHVWDPAPKPRKRKARP